MKEKLTVVIHTEHIKLEALMKYAGMSGTGGEAKQLIQDGEVMVNGEVCLQRGKKLYPGDRAELDGYELIVEAGK